MKRTVLLSLFLAVFVLAAGAMIHADPGKAAAKSKAGFFAVSSDAPDSLAILPPPPATGSLQFLLDEAHYKEGLIERGTERGAQASRDADLSTLPESFSAAFGMPISAESTPAIHALLSRMKYDLGLSTRAAKRGYMRVRPYVLYNAPTCYQPDEGKTRKNGSYPSGHSCRGWGFALVLAEINPQNKEAILKKGYEVGQSRVICGYHWQSDVDAGRIIASAAVACLHSNPEFQRMLAEAKAEFAAKAR